MGSRRSSRAVPRAFLFADLRGYTAFVERAGDTAASRLLRTYRDLVRRAVAKQKGAEIKTEGDSFYVVFDSSVAAVRCAVAIQRAAGRHRREGLAIGIGIHTGEATPFDRQYVGSAVNIAARLAAAAPPGEILISETVRGLIRTALRLPFEDRGPLSLKGIEEPIRAYSWRGAEPVQPPVEAPPSRPMDAVRRGDLDGAVRIARGVPREAPPEELCDTLIALSIVSAAHGDVEGALARSEQLLAVALRAPDRSWLRAAYGLRSWLYFLARQPGEARAELDRAFERSGTSVNACLVLLLSVTLGGSVGHVGSLRQIGRTASDAALAAAGAAVADAMERGADPATARRAVEDVCGPFLSALIELQLSARFHGEFAPDLRPRIMRAGWDRLAELVERAAQ